MITQYKTIKNYVLKDNVLEKVVLIVFLIVSLFLISLSLVNAQVSIDNVDIPPSINENSMLSVSFSASSDVNSAILYKIYIGNSLVSTNDTYDTFMNYSSAGNYTFTFMASDNESNISENDTVEVLNVPMIVTINNPVNTTYDNRTVNISVSLSTYADSCTYSINNSAYSSLSGGNNTFFSIVTLASDGYYSLKVTCSNVYNTANSTSYFSIDTVNLVLVSSSYTNDNSGNVILNAVTDTTCICKYDTSDKPYDSMAYTFSNTNSQQHTTTVAGLTDGSYSYYISCKNMLTNNTVLSPGVVNFNIVTIPSASIYLSKTPPLKAGTYSIRVATNKPVQNSPTLYYTLDNDLTARYVSLTGSGTDWSGYVIIDSGIADRAATFHFAGKDYNNNIGNVITQGELFLINSVQPDAPTSIETANQDDGSILIKWYYNDDNAVRYNIYRSTNSNVDYVDYYDSTTSKQYTDSNTVDGITYYYRIAAVDSADNDGILSGIVEATASRKYTVNNDNTITIQRSLNSDLTPKIDQQVVEFRKFLMDIDSANSDLGKINDPSKLKIINILGLADKIKSAQSTINGLIDQANSLKSQDLTSAQLDVSLNKLRLDAIKAEADVVEDIIVSDQSNYDQITQENDVNQAINSITENYNLSKKVLLNYTVANQQLQDTVTINTDISIFKIKYLGKDDYDKYTLIKKVVKANPQLDNVVIVESIPKDFAKKASDIIFDINAQKIPTTLQEDPVLRWDIDSLNSQTIYYMVNDNVDISSAKNAKTVVLNKPDFKFTDTVTPTDSSNSFTGLVAFETVNISKISPIQWVIFAGVALIISLFVYYVNLDSQEKKNNAQRLMDHKIVTRRNVQPSVKPDVKSVPIISASTNFNIVKKLEEANTLINNFDYEQSRSIYNECMEKFDKTPFQNESARCEAKDILNHIYLKLTAYRIIYQSRKHLGSKNYLLVRQDIVKINSLYAKLLNNLSSVDENNKDTERKFVGYVVNSRRHMESLVS